MKQRILVTGSTRGIGKGIAESLLAEGHAVTLHGRNKNAEVEALLASYPETADFVGFDVSDRNATRDALATAVEKGGFWGIVCNAGTTSDQTFAGLSGEIWDEILATNLTSFYNVVQPLVLPLVRLRSGGRIIVMSSVAGVVGNKGQVHYSASKAGLIGASKSLAQELASRGITVNVVAPGFIETELLGTAPRDELAKRVPLGRLGQVEEVASLVRYLLSPPAGYMTGQVLTVAGGIG